MKIAVSQKAAADLLRIFTYRAEQNPASAEQLIAAIDRKFAQLADFPFIGRERTSLREGSRSVLVGTHLVFYLVESDRIVIVRVIDGRMEIDEEFQR
jgi:toxin ParE1/3/4